MSADAPTPYPDVNAILAILLERMQSALPGGLVGVYLDGSLVNGGFDRGSDLDFVAITAKDVTERQFRTLRTMHRRLAKLDSPWACQIEGSYVSQAAVRRYAAGQRCPNIERGENERLKWGPLDESWAIHRRVVREKGLALIGPPPATLIDPVSRDDLRRAVLPVLHGWMTDTLDRPQRVTHRGFQSFIVLTLCRILYTLRQGDVASKQDAAAWVVENGGGEWAALIERAFVARVDRPGDPPDPEEVSRTLDFIRYTLQKAAVS